MTKFDLILIHPPKVLDIEDPGSVYNAYLSSANDIAEKKYITDKVKEKIISENQRRQKDNSCIFYSVENCPQYQMVPL